MAVMDSLHTPTHTINCKPCTLQAVYWGYGLTNIIILLDKVLCNETVMNMSSERKYLRFSEKLKVLNESEGERQRDVAEQFGEMFLERSIVHCQKY